MKNKITYFLLFGISICFAQVGISTTTPHASAELEVSSASRGLLLPRLTTAAITALSSTASEGLVVFDTDRKVFLGWDGTKWQVLGNVPITVAFADWELSSLTGVSAATLTATSTTQITSAILSRGSGLNSASAGSAWGASDFENTTLANAISGGDFFLLTMILPSSSLFSFTKIGASNLRKSPTGPTFFQWQYSTNGTTFSDIGTLINLTTNGNPGNDIPEILLNSIPSLQNISNTTIYFRLVGYGGSIGGNGFLNDFSGKDLQIIGTYN